MATILLTDGQQRKTLSAARSLGRAGHRVLVGEVTRFATARFSRYVARGLVYPSPAANPAAFAAWLHRAVKRHRIDVVMPMDEVTTRIVIAEAAALGAATLLPDTAAFETAADKGATVALARRAGVRVPRTCTDPATALAGELGWPVVVKARHGSGARGIYRAADPTALAAVYQRFASTTEPPVVQEFIPSGRKFDVCLLFAATGEPVASFVQEELRGYPLWGGPSSLQESVDRPDLVAIALKLLAPIGWQGPVEVEFLEDPRTGEAVLMEINPRFWASLDLAVRCGIDFPLWTVALALGQVPACTAQYPVGRRCRWLLPGDILHFLANPDRFHMEPSFCHTSDQRTHDDILSWEDPLPTLGFCLAVLRYLFDVRMWKGIIR